MLHVKYLTNEFNVICFFFSPSHFSCRRFGGYPKKILTGTERLSLFCHFESLSNVFQDFIAETWKDGISCFPSIFSNHLSDYSFTTSGFVPLLLPCCCRVVFVVFVSFPFFSFFFFVLVSVFLFCCGCGCYSFFTFFSVFCFFFCLSFSSFLFFSFQFPSFLSFFIHPFCRPFCLTVSSIVSFSPGSFCTHTHKSVDLLLQVLRDVNEWDSLMNISNLLHRTPEPGK